MAKGPISTIAELLEQQPSLKLNRVPIYAGRKAQARSTSSRRIVIYPAKAGTVEGGSVPEALVDFKQVMAADCWGRDIDEAWALLSWLIQALESQGIGTEGAPGYWWNVLGTDFDIEADTTTEGETASLLFEVRFSVPAAPYDFGHLGNWPQGDIDAVSQDEPAYRENTDG